MGIIEFHVHDGFSFEADFGDESGDDVGIAPADEERAETAADTFGDADADTGCGCSKAKALGLLVVLGFLVVTGLVVKRTLGDDDADAEV
ncbi:hypothetical protein J2752_000565 [Halarchaeum rubridurum]|uniref:Uncharacterized protein n=1 Tax=Halarchaeum rubridurum TaxID=489911 RepID=A0A830FS83_9EURY|nr:hypothetical protein [Halarchaeum rubridurum]MBP1953684.1 hypothetical protein [Halarchaeum rubridurum]GGM53862.1 hypothetical protein GCM10009017_00250 [Halarchaeum rubridurum]